MFLTRLASVPRSWSPVTSPRSTCSWRPLGLRAAMDIPDGIDDIHFAQLTMPDVVRHRLVSETSTLYARPGGTGLTNWAQRTFPPDGRRRPPMSIEVSNESARRFRRGTDQRRALRDPQDGGQPGRNCRWCCSTPMRWPTCNAMDGSARTHRRDELPHGRARAGAVPMRPNPTGDAGDIGLCPQFAADQAVAAGHSLGHELALLTVHGVLCICWATTMPPSPTRRRRCSVLQRRLLEEWVADQVESYHIGRSPVREGPAIARQVAVFRRA